MSHWLGIGLVLAILVGAILLLRTTKERYSLHPELIRKLLHLAMGLTVLTLPWLFNQLWPVLILGTISTSGLWILRKSRRLKCRFSGVIDGVERNDESYGEIFFPLGVTGLFVLSQGQPVQYAIPVLLLTTADPAAALVGLRYGRRHYTTQDGYKSAEGSAAFVAVAFITALLPPLWSGAVGTIAALLIAVILALLLMLIEAIAWRGSDNLFIPIVGFLLLRTLINLTVLELTGLIILPCALVIVVMGRLFRWHRIKQYGCKPTNSSKIFAIPRRCRPSTWS